jgi:16S rRNA (adenine1518-N6/adenine1519-N6)-dimethyltransferase
MPRSAKLGQNFLHDETYARRIVALLETSAGPLLEIGAGRGVLSELLLEKYPGRPLTLIEIDPALAAGLEQRFAGPEGPRRGGRVRIVDADILQIDLANMFPRARVVVIGNLPYHISKPLVDWFIFQQPGIGEAVLMLQKDFVDKLLAVHGGAAQGKGKKYNAQSVVFQLLFRARRCFDVPAGAFLPTPQIVSTVLHARPAEPGIPGRTADFYDFVKCCFSERRKTLWNNLATRFDKEVLAAAAVASGLPAQARAEQLPAGTFPEIFRLFSSDGEKDRGGK